MRERLLLERYEITGLNREYLLSALAKRKIPVYHVRKLQKNKVRLTISASSRKKLFAFLDGSCYNVKKVRTFGAALPLRFLRQRPGIAVGLAIFVLAAAIGRGVTAGVRCVGSGAVYESEIRALLKEGGVKSFSLFSGVDEDELERKLFAVGKFSFVSVSRDGFRLVVRTELAGSSPEILGRGQTQLLADDDGEIVSVKVLRGTAAVKSGDKVKRGDVLVDGTVTVGEQTLPSAVLATVVMRCEKQTVYPLPKTKEEGDAARIFAAQDLPLGAVVTDCTAAVRGGEYVVTVTYEKQLFGG